MEYRDKIGLKFEADGPEKPGAIEKFQLVRETTHEGRRREGEMWRMQSEPGKPGYQREVLAEGISRSELAALISDGADWLSYIEKAGA